MLLFAAVVAGIGIALRSGLLPALGQQHEVAVWLRGLGAVGALGLLVVATLGYAFFFPGILLSMTAGFVYGPLAGLWLGFPACLAGAVLSFGLGRSVLRDVVARRLARHPRLLRLEEAFVDDGVKLVALLRLTPIVPFAIQNYGLSATRLRLRQLVLGSMIGSAPACLFHAYLGSLLAGGAGVETAGDTIYARLAYWLGFVASIAMVVFAIRAARRALSERLEPTGSG